jgi:hypothetical protein
MSLPNQTFGHRRLLRRLRKLKTDLLANDIARVARAEKWLKLGKPDRALTSLQHLKQRAWNHPWTERVFWRAAQLVEQSTRLQRPSLIPQ